MNVANVFGKKISLDYQTRPAPVMYPINTEFESVADTKPLLPDSSILNDSINSFDNLTKAPITGVYHSYDSSLNGFYRSSPDELPSYFSSQNELDFQPKMFHKSLRPCHSFDGLSENSSNSHEFDLQGNGWSKMGYPSLSYTHNSYVNKKNLFRPIKSRVTSPFLSNDSLVSWTDQENPRDSVELVVSNLDYNISSREWKEILYSTFRSAVMVISVAVKTQADNSNLGFVRVPTIEDARFAISQFHRKKIGYKRIHVSLKTEECQNNVSNVKNEVISLLKEAKGYVLPLFKFIEAFDRRYHRSITVSELYKMKDILEIREQGGAGRMVHLTALYSISPSKSDAENQNVNDPPICMAHCREDATETGEALDCHILPNVRLNLKTFTPQVHTMLQKHAGNLPLMSFPTCYAAEFQPLKTTENGVNLEHLISCVSGIKIVTGRNGVKKIQWEDNSQSLSDTSEVNGADHGHLNVTLTSSGPTLTQQLCQISREIVDLLKHSPQCRMAFSKFIPAYHHHFGRQCRVADYGYTKLIELFEAIPHVLQILGSGEKKMLTLSHRAQVRRFTSDLLRVLKVQTNKMISLSELPSAYLKVMEKQWDITEYGICDIEDVLSEISSGTIQISEDPDPVLSIPRREQTPAEIARTKQFSREVVDLLRHNALCEMAFNKFIPSYHHHFGRQCRVADYGFIKLIELFEAIPHVVEVDEDEERMLHLTKPERLRIFSANIYNLLKASPDQMLLLSTLEDTFNQLYDSPFDFGTLSSQEVLLMLQYQFQVEVHGGQKFVVMKSGSSHCPTLAQQIVQILMDHCSTGAVSMSLEDLCAQYKENYNGELDCSELTQLFDYVQILGEGESASVSLSPLQEFALCVKSLLKSYGSIPVSNFESLFHEHYGIEVKPALYNFPDVSSMLHSISNVAVIKGKVNKQLFLMEDVNADLYRDDCLISSHLQETFFPLSENYPSETMHQDTLEVLQVTEDKQDETRLWSTKTKSSKPPLVRTSNVSEIPLTKSQTKSNVQQTYSATNSQQHFKQIPINRYNSVDSCREGWSLVHPQLARTGHWQNGHLGQMDPMITQNQIRLNGGMAPYPTGYWQPAYPTARTTPHPQAYSSQSNLCQSMQNLHIAFTSVPMNLNSQYPSSESLQYQPMHSTEQDFVQGHFSYESLFCDGSPVGTSSLVNSPNKMQSHKSPKRSRLAAKFNVSTE